ncbi:MAG: hypothetical protein KJO95_05470 [Gammaproteobacteria bacterium]|nr:hypothetical protein [Gammaproteobacteria bacterium]MBU2676831.1 hypothetical protein [Gammaproteobacteria bacterium]NNL50565.1 hypothetical protein [Woeseiaceae bacterium]
MGFISRILGIVPKSESEGLTLDESHTWEVEPTRDCSKFVEALPTLLPEGAVVYLEGTTEPEVNDFLENHLLGDPQKVAIGTIWPMPSRYHVPCSTAIMSALAALLNDASIAYLCTHIHAYKNDKMLMEWHDAFYDVPVRISRQIDEEAVASFAEAVGKSYTDGTD